MGEATYSVTIEFIEPPKEYTYLNVTWSDFLDNVPFYQLYQNDGTVTTIPINNIRYMRSKLEVEGEN